VGERGAERGYPAAEPILISALEHYSYCPRQCALIHQEQTFDENLYTLRGRAVHERVDESEVKRSGEVRVERALPLWSERLGLVGRADVVEFHGDVPYPVEYKYGRIARWKHADVQVCAQAMCLEEMLSVSVPRGAVYHASSRRRREVLFDEDLRERVRATVDAVRKLMVDPRLPSPLNNRRCVSCSLRESCLPAVVAKQRRLKWLGRSLFTVDEAK